MRKVFCLFLFSIFLFILINYAGGEESFSFVVVTDLHVNEKDGAEKFKSFINQLNKLNPKPDFVVMTGDIHAEAFEKVFSELKPQIPFHVSFGNHEKREDRKILTKLLGTDTNEKDYYSFIHKGCKFILTCTATEYGDHIGHFESEGIRGKNQLEWLEHELEVNRNDIPLFFIFSHIPPSKDGKAGDMYLSTNDQRNLREWFKQYKPTAMFCGHLHQRIEFEIESVPVYIIPSINWNFNNQPAGFFFVSVVGSQYKAEFIQSELP